MKLRLLGKPREVMGSKVVELNLDGEVTLEELLNRLPKELKGLVTDGEKLKMIVLINGVSAESQGGLKATVRNEDEVTIMPEVGGG